MNLQLLSILFTGMFARHARLRRQEGGASVIEWALIAATVVIAAGIIGTIILNVVKDRGADIEKCSNVAASC